MNYSSLCSTQERMMVKLYAVVCLAALKGYCYCLSNIGTLVWDWGVL